MPDQQPLPMMLLSRAEAERWSYAVADTLCWLAGFCCAKGSDADLPPAWRGLREINVKLRQHIEGMPRD